LIYFFWKNIHIAAPNPDHSIALGAAVWRGIRSGAFQSLDWKIFDKGFMKNIVSIGIGVLTTRLLSPNENSRENINQVLIPAFTPCPTMQVISHTFYPLHKDQKEVLFIVTQGDSSNPE
jgi:molecular chaperone DnaK (HSP70)